MRFIDDYPMRPSCFGAKLLNSREETHEHGRTVRQRNAQEIEAQGVLHGVQDFEGLRNAWNLLRASKCDKSFKLVIVALGIK